MSEISLIKPQHLKKGDVVGLISPSAPLAGLLPHRVKQGIRGLKKIGLKVVVGKNALRVTGYTAGSPKERANDINRMFKNKTIKAIIAMIGGNHSNQLLSYLDYKMIRKNPKPFIGYSDLTVLQFALYRKVRLVTFYGPCLLTQFAENPDPLQYTVKYFRKALFNSQESIGEVQPSQKWTEEILDWFEKKDLVRPRILKPNTGWEWLKEGEAEGRILGGCIASMMHLRGTGYWPNFTDSILFWEIPEGSNLTEGESPSTIDAYLMDLELSGVFKEIRGMIIGRPYHYTEEQLVSIKKIIKERTRKYRFPLLFNIDIGHTDPMITIPLGVNAQLNSSTNSFVVKESGVV